MHISSLRRYITMTYKKLGDRQLANYWNLGYINCLMDNKIVDRCVGAGLAGYNDRVYFIEEIKIIKRKNKIDGYFFPKLRDLAINTIRDIRYGECIIFKKEVNKMIELRDIVKDTVTGFKGMVVAKHIYMNGCVRFSVVSKELESGKIVDEYIDEEQLVIIKKAEEKAIGKTEGSKEEEKPPGGSGDVPSFKHP